MGSWARRLVLMGSVAMGAALEPACGNEGFESCRETGDCPGEDAAADVSAGGVGGSGDTDASSGGSGEASTEPKPCDPGEEACIGNVAHICTEDGIFASLNSCDGDTVLCIGCTLGADCEDQDDCAPGGCVDDHCTECIPSTTDCNVTIPRTCSNEGDWISEAACDGQTPVCRPEHGDCAECVEGATECLDPSTERICLNGVWEEAFCDLGCIAATGVCRIDTVATPGVVACDPESGANCDVESDYCCLRQEGEVVRECRAHGNTCNGPQQESNWAECDWHDDCQGGEVCCLQQCTTSGMCTRCTTICPVSLTRGPLCNPEPGTPCPNDGTCQPATQNAQASILRELEEWAFYQCLP